jgi:hypothetical protein
MNEVDWLTATDPSAMLAYLEGKTTDRKLRLFACACVRRAWGRLQQGSPAQRAVETAERLAEGQAEALDLEQAREQAEQAAYAAPHLDAFSYVAAAACCADDPLEAARTVRESMRQHAVRETANEVAPGEDEARFNAVASAAECRAQADLLREVIGNPFRPPHLAPEWLRWNNGAVAAMARVLAEEQRFAELPYLADALEDAGCDDADLLRHLRGPGPHVRGCWAVDLLLGRG